MIDRKKWLARHNPVLTAADSQSPLSVGNGNFAFTADISGLQTLYRDYLGETPLCTMANWGWHTIPAPTPSGRYTLDDVQMNRYDFCGREVTYAKTRFPGNEHVYDWLRQNPHKLNLGRIGLRLAGEDLKAEDFSCVRQELDLYTGTLKSRYQLHGEPCCVTTACAAEQDAVAIRVETELLLRGLSIDIDLPYGAPDITGSAWDKPDRHTTVLEGCVIRREMDSLRYTIRVDAPGALLTQTAPHQVRITAQQPCLELAVTFTKESEPAAASAQAVLAESAGWWGRFWEKGGAIDFSAAADPRAMELERRIILSLYLLTINSSGSVPPAETGLICNSWYGKAHLEMHYWHMAWAPLWGHSELLMRGLPWYHAHLPEARANAARNGYRGARWPKMVADDALDSPSSIAVLLVWQQPHIIVMLDMIRRALQRETPDAVPAFLREHWPLIRETAEFMADYAMPDAQGVYHIMPPVIPVQERYDAASTRDPSFEVAYWKFGLGLAIAWTEAAGMPIDPKWQEVFAHMAPPPVKEGLYIAHADYPDTFVTKLTDHPSMLQCYGMLPRQDVDPEAMRRTLQVVMDKWDYKALWGWDFAVIAMTATRLGQPGDAIDQLLCVTNKNTYVTSGNNRQITRNDLPLYLPGNGSLLLAAALMAAGCDDTAAMPGFRPEAGWQVQFEGLHPSY